MHMREAILLLLKTRNTGKRKTRNSGKLRGQGAADKGPLPRRAAPHYCRAGGRRRRRPTPHKLYYLSNTG